MSLSELRPPTCALYHDAVFLVFHKGIFVCYNQSKLIEISYLDFEHNRQMLNAKVFANIFLLVMFDNKVLIYTLGSNARPRKPSSVIPLEPRSDYKMTVCSLKIQTSEIPALLLYSPTLLVIYDISEADPIVITQVSLRDPVANIIVSTNNYK